MLASRFFSFSPSQLATWKKIAVLIILEGSSVGCAALPAQAAGHSLTAAPSAPALQPPARADKVIETEAKPKASSTLAASEKAENRASSTTSLLQAPLKADKNQPKPSDASLFADFTHTQGMVEVEIINSAELLLEAASPSGSWVAYCRTEKRLQRDSRTAAPVVGLEFLSLLGQSNALPQASLTLHSIDSISPNGRFLVVINTDGEPMLLDSQLNTLVSLAHESPDLRRDQQPAHRSFAFDRSSKNLGLLTTSGSVRFFDLETGNFSDLKRESKREIWRLEASGQGFILRTLAAGATPQSWPTPLAKTPRYRCRKPGKSFQTHSELIPLRPLKRVQLERLERKGTQYQSFSAPGFLQSFQSGWLRRTDNGELFLVEGKRQKRLTSSRCGGRIIFASESSKRFLILCEQFQPVVSKPKRGKRGKRRYRFEIYFIAPGFVRDTGKEMARTNLDEVVSTERFTSFRAGREHLLADSKTLELYPLNKAQVLAYSMGGALLLRGQDLSYWTPSQERSLPMKVKPFDTVLSVPGAISVGQYLIQLPSQDSSQLQSRAFEGKALRLNEDGSLLIRAESTDRLIRIEPAWSQEKN